VEPTVVGGVVTALKWTFEDVAADTAIAATFSVTVNESAVTLTEIKNKAQIKVGDRNPKWTNETHDPLGPKQTTVTGVVPGDTIPYTINIPLTEDADKVVIRDIIPTGTILDFASVDGLAARARTGAVIQVHFTTDLTLEALSPISAITTDNAADVDAISWTWTAELNKVFEAGKESFNAGFTVVVDDLAPDVINNVGSYTIGDNNPIPTNTIKTPVTPDEKSSDYNNGSNLGLSVGDIITYTIEYENESGASQLVTITDDIPAHTAYVKNNATYKVSPAADATNATDAVDADKFTYTPSPAPGTAAKTTWGPISVPAGETLTVTFQVRVLQSALIAAVTTIDNKAVVNVNGTPHDTNTVHDPLGPKQSDVETNLTVGDEVTYRIKYKVTADDVGLADAVDVEIRDAIPHDTIYVENSATLKVKGVNVTITDADDADDAFKLDTTGDPTAIWTIEDLEAGDEIEVTFKATVLASALLKQDKSIHNTAYIDIDNGPTITTNEVIDPVEPDRKSSSAKADHPDGLVVGDKFTYTIEWENTSTTSSAQIVVIDAIPKNTAYDPNSVSTGGRYLKAGDADYVWSYDTNGNGYVIWSINAPKSPETGSTGTVTFRVVVLQSAWDELTIDNEGIIIVNDVEYETNTTKDKMAIKQSNAPVDGIPTGDNAIVTYRITYRASKDVDKIVITDPIPDGTVYVADSAKGIFGYQEAALTVLQSGVTVETKQVDGKYRLVWTFSNLPNAIIKQDQWVTVEFKVKVLDSALDLPARQVHSKNVPASNIANYGWVEELRYTERDTTNDELPKITNPGEDDPYEDNDVATEETSTNVVITPILPDEKSSNSATIAGAAGLIPGKVLTYTIDYKNTSTEISDITITDSAPLHTQYKIGSAKHGSTILTDAADGDEFEQDLFAPSGVNDLIWTIRNVGPGVSGKVSFQVTILQSAVTVDEISNTASIQIGVNTPHTTNEVKDPMGVKQADTLDGNSTTGTGVYVADRIKYTVKFYNATNDTLDYTITDATPTHTTYYKENNQETAKVTTTEPQGVGITSSVDVSGLNNGKGNIVWHIDNVPPGGSGKVEFTVTVDDDTEAHTHILNTADISYFDGYSTKTSKTNETDNEVLPKKEYVIVNEPTRKYVRPGDTIQFTVNYTVPSSVNPVELVITDAIPAYTSYVEGSMTSNIASQSSGLRTSGAIVAPAANGAISARDKANNRYTNDKGVGTKYVEWYYPSVGGATQITVTFNVLVALNMPTRYQIENIAFCGDTPTNGVTPPPPPPPPIVIDEEDPPLSPFIDDHFAYIIGYPDGNVRPSRNVTRAEVATVFFRMLSDDVRAENWTQQNQYPDVELENWFNNAISVVNKMGIVNGYPDGTFRPNGYITRAELATIAARFARQMMMLPTNDRTFSDIAGHWAEDDIQYAAEIGWVRGYTDGTYRPNQYITRAEFMTLVNRMLGRAPETEEDLLDDMVHWPDNADTTAWYYVDVQEATNSHFYDRKEDKFVPDLTFEYETWTEMRENRDWVQFEKEWSTANSASNPGEVIK
jgi:uncharacterized repeat protein (TIGR01451 family)/fimbrial isopeptide formation D2 family protein